MADATTLPHGVTWELMRGDLETTFLCDAGPDAPCHSWCNRSECEDNCATPDAPGHNERQGDDCTILPWLDDDEGWYSYVGPPTTPHDGTILPNWTGDHYVWSYA